MVFYKNFYSNIFYFLQFSKTSMLFKYFKELSIDVKFYFKKLKNKSSFALILGLITNGFSGVQVYANTSLLKSSKKKKTISGKKNIFNDYFNLSSQNCSFYVFLFLFAFKAFLYFKNYHAIQYRPTQKQAFLKAQSISFYYRNQKIFSSYDIVLSSAYKSNPKSFIHNPNHLFTYLRLFQIPLMQ